MKNQKLSKKKDSEIIPLNKGWEGFYKFNTDNLVNKFISEEPEYFDQKGREMAFKLFHEMSVRVPAYKDFLKKQKINPRKIETFKDLDYVPWIDKENYLKKYSMNDLSRDGKFVLPIISASSGTSGMPTFWPRSWNIELETSYIYELFLKHIFEINKYKTLLVNGFAMGIYVGGTFTLNCSMRLSQKGYPLTIITPGVIKKEIIQSIKNLSPYFQQTIVGCYPPMLRDILEECIQEGINLREKKIKLFFASESFNENFRSYLYETAGIKNKDYFTSSMNLYGTADAAIAGHETPLSIFVRKLFSCNSKNCNDFFGDYNVPSLNMYYPFFKYYQVIDNEIILSSCNNQIPLFKYNIHDRGGIITYRKMLSILKVFGVTKNRLIEEIGQEPWRLPFIYLYGRSDYSVKLYGALISPETIRKTIETKKLNKYLTSKFTMVIRTNQKHEEYIEINMELKPKTKATKKLETLATNLIVRNLLSENIEYKSNFKSDPEKQTPKIILWNYEDPKYFKPGIKQKWSMNS